MALSGREFDPAKKYKVVLSERLKNGDFSDNDESNDYSYASVQVDPDLKIPNTVKSSDIKRIKGTEDEWNLHLVGSKSGENYNYVGNQQSTKTCVLIFDPENQTFVLDRIDTELSFTQDQTGATSEASGSEDGTLNALIEQEGEADADNPYDWRHQLKRRRSSTPGLEPFDPLSLDALGPSPSPEPTREDHDLHRQASTPPGETDQDLEQQYEDELESHESSDNGGLEIVMDGANEPRSRFGRGRVFQRTEAADGPISLRSAANSRSPAVEGASSGESDGDVDEMKLGSPMRRDNGARNVEEQEDEEDEVKEDTNMGDADDDLEAEFEQMLEGGDEGEGAEGGSGGAPAATYADDSSSESEEE